MIKPVHVWEKDQIVVWPHRVAPEKDLAMFLLIRNIYREAYPNDKVSFVVAKEAASTKGEYYSLLSRAKVVVSTAHQETFGIAMLEGLNSGCFPVVPDRLSYRELYPRNFRHDCPSKAVKLIKQFLGEQSICPLTYTPDLSWIGEL